ncbi:MAG: DUF192 domain-containing protein [Alphaproteobacteria bacterium]|jgi:uncharacterized membrane protein (UPF0127 family)|nr:DUF192 domain-containing protein [Alphaproteobacteria bacterium]
MLRSTLLRLFFAAAILSFAAVPVAAQPQPTLPTEELRIESGSGGDYRFTVELAVTPQQQARGLMFREEMAPDHGMLFLFDPVRPVSFWMRNTPLSLDMLFIDAEGLITNIAARTTPMSDRSYASAGPVRAVLEVNAGVAALLGIEPGDRVIHDAFGPRTP